MLHIADALRDLEQVSMPPAAKQAGRERLRKAVLARQRRRPRSAVANGLRMAAWAAAFLIVCTGAISGLNRAAANTLPDEPLYAWKRATERVWLGIQTSPEREIAVSLALADRRVDEMKRLYQRSGRVDRQIINQLQVDYTRTLQLIDTLPPDKAQPLLAQAKAIGAEHEQELMQLAQQATGTEQETLLAAVLVSQWVQRTSPEQATASPPAIPGETSTAPTNAPAVPSATSAPAVPGGQPGPTTPVAPPASDAPPANNPSTQPGVPPTVLPATPEPTAGPLPPANNPPAVPQPTTPPRPAPTEKAKPPKPTEKAKPPEPTQAPPTAAPPTAAPTDPSPGPPSNPPGNPTAQPGPTIEPPGNPTAQPGPPNPPPGNPTVQPGPPSNPPGNPTVQPGPPIDPPGQVKTPKPTDPPKEEKPPKPTDPPKEEKPPKPTDKPKEKK